MLESIYNSAIECFDFFFNLVLSIFENAFSIPLYTFIIFTFIALFSFSAFLFFLFKVRDVYDDSLTDKINSISLHSNNFNKKSNLLIYDYFQNKKEKKIKNDNFLEDWSKADTYFKNNPNKMSVHYNGHTFYNDNWEKFRYDKQGKIKHTYVYDEAGNVIKHSISSTEYENDDIKN